ncbi:N-6 DNA methylase [Shewanella baltica]|uniref:N-6 DNA methylase n=1 Tax=Shewanella baltica TaxID=62322 RepID=UPI00217DC5CC|nr:N-6 DNA methylase [Shewanella baltica]
MSGRENAFDKLVNLFLCKLVDEIENPDDLKFYWKGVAYDSHFDLMDRLQQLYQSGMDKFLGEDITYINQNDVNNALRFIRQNPDATQKAVWNLFIQQKFFTNNDFSFIDVHNERLFYQNADVLLKLLQMWQDIRLTNPNGHNQFLGDMFEGFLDQGVRQSEGQFFTPMPICRFIMMSLPLERLVRDNPMPPMAIDYACGAGHFLTELALQLQPLLSRHKPQANPAEYHKSMVGIEKEYRLSKVAKVSAFMYGQQGIQVCYGDGLVNSHDAFPDIRDGHFDLLVANPPYSVRGFLETLPEEERKAYSLTDTINDAETANSIETFFIERAKQLLKSGGVAAIILPSSILSNGGSTYIRAREILLQYFDIIAIAEFGSGTFGKTGTNTVTLFLRRKPTQPDTAEHYRERIEEWFKGSFASKRKQVIYKDGHLIEQYCTHINVALADYQSLLRGEDNGSWKPQEYFQTYHEAFEKSTELKNIKKTKKFKALSKAEQTAEIAKRYLAYVQGIEQDKLYHFCLASDQSNPVLIIRSPTGTKEIKQFLGYEWSGAKGDEGIKLLEDASGKHVTTLYDGPDHANPVRFTRTNPAKLNSYIAANFDGTVVPIPNELCEVANSVRLIDIIDFSLVAFEKQFSLAVRTNLTTVTKWPQKPIRQVAILNPQKSELKGVDVSTEISFVEMASVSASGYITSAVPRKLGEVLKGSYTYFAEDDIIIAKITPCMENGKCAIARGLTNSIGMGSSEFHVIRADKNQIQADYLFYFLNRNDVRTIAAKNMTGSSGHRRVPEQFYSDLLVPIPTPDVQKQIALECQEVELKVDVARSDIEKAMMELSAILADAQNTGEPQQLGKVILKVSDSVDPQSKSGIAHYIGLENIEGSTGNLTGELHTPYAEIKSTKTVFSIGDILYGKLRPNLNKVHLAKQDGICSTDILVLRPKNKEEAIFYTQYFLSESFNEAVVRTVSGQQLPRTSWGKMQVIKIPVLEPKELTAKVTKIDALEKQIAKAQSIIDSAPVLKEAVMKKYL